MQRKCGGKAEGCGFFTTAQLICDLWTMMMIRELLKGPKRFKDFEENIGGMSTRTLTCRLNSLEENKYITRIVHNTAPPKVEYELTEKGLKLKKIIREIEKLSN